MTLSQKAGLALSACAAIAAVLAGRALVSGDDLHRTVTELRRDMRALKAEIARLRGANAAPAGGPTQARARSKPRRKTPKAGKAAPPKPGSLA